MGDGTDGVGTARRERLIAESGSGSRALAEGIKRMLKGKRDETSRRACVPSVYSNSRNKMILTFR